MRLFPNTLELPSVGTNERPHPVDALGSAQSSARHNAPAGDARDLGGYDEYYTWRN